MKLFYALLVLTPLVAFGQAKPHSGGGGTTYTGTDPITVSGTSIGCTAAGTGQAGCLNTSAQNIPGAKTFLNQSTFSAGLVTSAPSTFNDSITITSTGASLVLPTLGELRWNGTTQRLYGNGSNGLVLGGSEPHLLAEGNVTAQGAMTGLTGSFGTLMVDKNDAGAHITNPVTSTHELAIVGYIPDGTEPSIHLEAGVTFTGTNPVLQVSNNGTWIARFIGDYSLLVRGGIRANAANEAEPTCDSSYRGRTWYKEGGAGVSDTYEICMKTSADAYGWQVIKGSL